MKSIRKSILLTLCSFLLLLQTQAQVELVDSLNQEAEFYADKGDYLKAISFYNQTLNIHAELNNEEGLATTYIGLGNVYEDIGNYTLAFDYFNKAQYLFEKLGNNPGLSKCLNNMGIIYKNQGLYDKALACYSQSMEIETACDNKPGIITVNINLGNLYKRLKDFEAALNYLQEALDLAKEINDTKRVATCLNNIGDIYLNAEELPRARAYYNEAKSIHTANENPLGICNSLLGIAFSYAGEEQYSEAITNALKSLEISKKLALTDYESNIYFLLFQIYKEIGDFENALESHEQYKVLEDSLFNQQTIDKLAQIEYEYKYKQELEDASNRELSLTKTVLSTSQDLEKSQRNSFIAIIGFLLLSLVSGGTIFFLKLKQVQAENKNILIQQKLLRLQMTPHFIFNSLSILQGLILNKEDKKSLNYLSKFSKLLRITLENSRHKTVSLESELEALNSYMSIQNLDMNPPYQFELAIDPKIKEFDFQIPPMLIQPFIENVIEHAFIEHKENKEIKVQLNYQDKKLICTIADNGIGINTSNKISSEKKISVATSITTERLKILSREFKVKGSISVVNRKTFGEQGTLVTLIIPYKLK